jgi:uncharacterized membrane protein
MTGGKSLESTCGTPEVDFYGDFFRVFFHCDGSLALLLALLHWKLLVLLSFVSFSPNLWTLSSLLLHFPLAMERFFVFVVLLLVLLLYFSWRHESEWIEWSRPFHVGEFHSVIPRKFQMRHFLLEIHPPSLHGKQVQ